jgi:hypothetical protein
MRGEATRLLPCDDAAAACGGVSRAQHAAPEAAIGLTEERDWAQRACFRVSRLNLGQNEKDGSERSNRNGGDSHFQGARGWVRVATPRSPVAGDVSCFCSHSTMDARS